LKKITIISIISFLFVLSHGKDLGAFPWNYDMWVQPSIQPYEQPMIYPENSVTTEGDTSHPAPREGVEQITVNPVPNSSESVKKGEELFQYYCVVCHGPEGMGDGIIVKTGKGFYPVNLKAPATVGRTDGYIYAYIRYGGYVMMPSYRESVDEKGAWDIVNYVRKLQNNQ